TVYRTPTSSPLTSFHHPRIDILLFFFHHPATTEIYTLSLHDALPISVQDLHAALDVAAHLDGAAIVVILAFLDEDEESVLLAVRSEEHTSELQSRFDLVCRLLLEKKNHVLRNGQVRVVFQL